MSYAIVNGKLVKRKRSSDDVIMPVASSKLSILIPDDIKDDIAMVVQSYVLPFRGVCFYRAIIGKIVLDVLGIESRICIGSMLHRAGPDPWRDVVAFCGPGNVGCISPGGGFQGHVWLQTDNDRIDFTLVDWRDASGIEEDGILSGDADYGLKIANEQMGAIQWTAPSLPDYFWQPIASFPKWKQWTSGSKGDVTPSLGEVWYGGFRGSQTQEANRRFQNITRDLVNDPIVIGLLKNNITGFRLKARIAELKKTAAVEEAA
jgi:hypothetical protein